MANIINLNAEIGANYIGDDAQPAVAFTNSSTGPGLSVDKLSISSTVSVGQINLVQQIGVAAATVAPVNLVGNSIASGAVLALKFDSFVSAVSLIFAAGANWAGMGAIRVVRTDGTFGWIPVLPNGQVTAAAVA